MISRVIHEAEGQRTIAVILDTGDEVMDSLKAVAAKEAIGAASITGIGAFSEVVLAYFDWEKCDYVERAFPEQLEVASLIGDIAIGERQEPLLHLHVVLGRRDYSAIAGHLMRGVVRPTLELIITESPAHLCRRKDEATGLPLISL